MVQLSSSKSHRTNRQRQAHADAERELAELTVNLFGLAHLDDQLALLLEILSTRFEFSHAAVALTDHGGTTLTVRKALGFDDDPIESAWTSLDSTVPSVRTVIEHRPVWFERAEVDNDAVLGRFSEGNQVLALPLLASRWLSESESGLHRRFEASALPERDLEGESSDEICIGALFVGADRNRIDEEALCRLLLLSRAAALAIFMVLQRERLLELVKRLRLEQQWVHSIIQSVADPIVLTNFDNEILLENRRAQELLSVSGEASEGKMGAVKMNDLLFSAYLSSVAVGRPQVAARDLTLIDPIEGSDLHFEIVSSPALNERGEPIGIVSVFRDVTDLRCALDEIAYNFRKLQETEAEAHRERHRLELMIENVGDPVVVTDDRGNFILLNRPAARFFESGEAGGPEMVKRVQANAVKLTSFLTSLVSEYLHRDKKEIEFVDPQMGKSVPMEVTAVAIQEPTEQVTTIVSILHDLSQIRELERRRIEGQLFEAEKLAAVGRLAASIAHEVNNPLEAIKNSLYLLESESESPSSSQFLRVALQETERVSHIVRQMLGVVRRSEGYEWVELNHILDETLLLLDKKLKQTSIQVIRMFAADLPLVCAFPDQLKQVFLNLLLNAQQAMEETTHARLVVRTRRGDLNGRGAVCLEFTDSGPGIDETVRDRIFDPFFSTRKKGTGLGLWITQHIVHRHGGIIEVESPGQRGATFRILLPPDFLPNMQNQTRTPSGEALREEK